MTTITKVSTLPVITATNQTVVVGYDPTQPLGSQDVGVNLNTAINTQIAANGSAAATLTLTGDASGHGAGTIAVTVSGLSTLSAGLASETSRAEGVENSISGSLTGFITSTNGSLTVHTNAIAANASAISVESARAQGVEAGHTTSIGTLTTNVGTLNTTVAGHTTSIGTLTTGVANNATAISGETYRATTAEGVLTSNVGTLNTKVTNLQNAQITGGALTNAGVLQLTSTNGVMTVGQVVPSFNIGQVQSLASGAQATASITGFGLNYSVNLGLPAGSPGTPGQTGSIGVSPTITIGTVTSLPASSPASATITGSGTAYTLNIGIPAGNNGNNGSNGTNAIIGQNPLPWNASTNSPALSNGGGGASAGAVYICTNAGATSLDGNTYNIGDIALNVNGTAWVKIANAGGTGVVSSLTLPNLIMTDDNSSNDYLLIVDQYGNIGYQFTDSGFNALSVNANVNAPVATIASLTTTGNAALTGGATITNGIVSDYFQTGNITISENNDGAGNIIFVDALGNIGPSISAAGILNFAGNTTVNTGFTATDFVSHNQENLAHSWSVRGQINSTAQRPVFNYNGYLVYGQSKACCDNSAPAITLTQPFDNLMMGASSRPLQLASYQTANTTWNPCGGSTAFQPLISANQTNAIGGAGSTNALYTPRTGSISGAAVTCAVTGSGNSAVATFTFTSANPSSIFAVNDTFQMQGWTTYTANNFTTTSSGNIFTVTAVTSTTMTANGFDSAAAGTESNVTFAQVIYQPYGEDLSVTTVNELRKLQLDRMNVASLPSQKMVLYNCAISGQTVAQLSAGATPNEYNRIPDATTKFVAQATSTGGTGTTSGVPIIYWSQGGSDAQQGTSKAVFKTQTLAMFSQMTSDVMTITGQKYPPMIFSAMTSGGELYDFQNAYQNSHNYAYGVIVLCGAGAYLCTTGGTSSATGSGPTGTGTNITDGSCTFSYFGPSGELCATTMAQLEMHGCSPMTGYGTPTLPNNYLIGPDYQFADHGGHLTNNGYRNLGAMVAKVVNRVLTGNQWMPLHMRSVGIRANTALIDWHVPCPPLQILPIFVVAAITTFTDYGFSAFDNTGQLMITNVQIVSDTSVLITCNRNFGAGAIVKYADQMTVDANGNQHHGSGNLADSDTSYSLDNWIFNLGSGQLLSDNQPGTIGPNNPAVNNAPYPLQNFACPFAVSNVPTI